MANNENQEMCFPNKLRILKVESYHKESNENKVLSRALADHEIKVKPSETQQDYNIDKKNDIFDKEFWENLCKNANKHKVSNDSSDGLSPPHNFLTSEEEFVSRTENFQRTDASFNYGSYSVNTDNETDLDINDYSDDDMKDNDHLSNVMNDHNYMSQEVNSNATNKIITSSEDLKNAINKFLLEKIKKESKDVSLQNFVDKIMNKITAFDAESSVSNINDGKCPEKIGDNQNVLNKEELLVNTTDSNKLELPLKNIDSNPSCGISSVDRHQTRILENPTIQNQSSDCNKNSFMDQASKITGIQQKPEMDNKENWNAPNDFESYDEPYFEFSENPSEILELLDPNFENINDDDKTRKECFNSDQNLVSNQTLNPEVQSIHELSNIAKKICSDCLLYDPSNCKLNNRQFAILKLEEFKQHVFEICGISSKEIAIQTEKIISTKMLRKINEKDKINLLQDSSSIDSSSSYSDNDDDDDDETFTNLTSHKNINPDRALDQTSPEGLDSIVNASSNSSDSDHEIMRASSTNAMESMNKKISSKDEMVSETMAYNESPNRFPHIKFDSKKSDENDNKCETVTVNEDLDGDIKTEKIEQNELNSNLDTNNAFNKKNSLLNEKITDEMTKDELEKLKDSECDKEIEKLINFKGLSKRKAPWCYTSSDSSKNKSQLPAKKPKSLFEILDECDEAMSDESLSQEEESVITEKEYLKKCNENFKEQLLNSSTDSDLAEECLDDFQKILETHEEDEDKPPLVEKFLETFDVDNIDNEDNDEQDQENDLTTSSDNNESIKSLLSSENSDKDQKKDEKDNLDLISTKSSKSEASSANNTEGSSDCEILDDTLKKKNVRPKSLDKLLADADRRKKIANIDAEFISLSSDSDTNTEEQPNETEESPTKRFLKPMLRQDQLAGGTRQAQKQETSRLNRLDKKNQAMAKAIKEYYTDIAEAEKEVILDYNTESKTFIKVHPDIVKYLKPHQVEGVKFMYDNCFGSVENLKKYPGSGCILAHCMGLGKTLQLIALIHTVISHQDLKTSKVLVLCPKSTVMNWADEVQRWVGSIKSKVNLKVFSFSDTSDINEKLRILEEWSISGTASCRRAGVLLIGYEAFRTLVFFHSYKKKRILTTKQIDNIKDNIRKYLLEPGADLVVCDEGHIIKNERSAISLAVADIRTPRRIVLTGTPIQNNLKEYYSMVNFIKPSFLGTSKEFANLYANPIKNGQHKDSSKRDIKVMKQRSFVLHKKLSKFVQRKEAALLKSFLPQKFEYVLFLPMTDVQVRLYERILEVIAGRVGSTGKSLITDYTCFRKIWTHPKVLENAWKNATQGKMKKEARRTLIQDDEDDQPDDIYDRQTGVMSVTNDWWRQYLTEDDLESILPSTKLRTMFEIIRMCEENGEKCLIFSAFVAVLNVVEDFFNKINQKDPKILKDLNPNGVPGRFRSSWVNGVDYYRLDGKTPKTIRHEMVKSFNSSSNTKARVFLISAKAGGQGINLIGANRVIILDTSWNPSNDQQNIFRIFRLGQQRNCYIYRLLAMGTMEEKVYSRSVTKQAMSFRVVDEHQIERHYNMEELTALYTLTKADYSERPTPTVPQDNILANLVRNHPQLVYKYHEHDSLLENKVEQELSEQEKADAWAAYENELKASTEPGAMFGLPDGLHHSFGMSPNGSYNPGIGGFNPLNYQFGLTSPFNFPVPNNSYLDLLNSMYSQYSSSPLMYGNMPSSYNTNLLPMNSNSLANQNVGSLLHNVANPLSALGSLAYNGMDPSTRITNSGSGSSTYAPPMYSASTLPYNLPGSSAGASLASSLAMSPLLESFQRRTEGASNSNLNKNTPLSENLSRELLTQNLRPSQITQSPLNVSNAKNIEPSLTSPVAGNQPAAQVSTTQSNLIAQSSSNQKIVVRSSPPMTSSPVTSSNAVLSQQKPTLIKSKSPSQNVLNVTTSVNAAKGFANDSIPISVIKKPDSSIKSTKDKTATGIQNSSIRVIPAVNSVVSNKLPSSGSNSKDATNSISAVSLKNKTELSRPTNMGIVYSNRNSPKPAAASPVNMNVGYQKTGSPTNTSNQIKASSTVKTGSSLQGIPTRNATQDSIPKQLEQISINKVDLRTVKTIRNNNVMTKVANASDSPVKTPTPTKTQTPTFTKTPNTRIVQTNIIQKKNVSNNVDKKNSNDKNQPTTTFFTPIISSDRNNSGSQLNSRQVTVKNNLGENKIIIESKTGTKLLPNQLSNKKQQPPQSQANNNRVNQLPQTTVSNKRYPNVVINKTTKANESPNQITTTITRAPNDLLKQSLLNNNLNAKRVITKSSTIIAANKIAINHKPPQLHQPSQEKPVIKRIELNPTSLAAVKNSLNSNTTSISKSASPSVLKIDKNSKSNSNLVSYNNLKAAKSGGATITRVVNVNKRTAGPTNSNDSPSQLKKAKLSDFVSTSPKYSNTVVESIRKVQATNSLTIVPSSLQTPKVVNKKDSPTEIVELD